MRRKCIMCGELAEYTVKDRPECYCKDHAEDLFGDLSYLQSIEEEAQKLKKVLVEKGYDADQPNDDS